MDFILFKSIKRNKERDHMVRILFIPGSEKFMETFTTIFDTIFNGAFNILIRKCGIIFEETFYNIFIGTFVNKFGVIVAILCTLFIEISGNISDGIFKQILKYFNNDICICKYIYRNICKYLIVFFLLFFFFYIIYNLLWIVCKKLCTAYH